MNSCKIKQGWKSFSASTGQSNWLLCSSTGVIITLCYRPPIHETKKRFIQTYFCRHCSYLQAIFHISRGRLSWAVHQVAGSQFLSRRKWVEDETLGKTVARSHLLFVYIFLFYGRAVTIIINGARHGFGRMTPSVLGN